MTTAAEPVATPAFPQGPRRAGADDFVPGADYFEAVRPGFGRESIDLAIGPVVFRLESLSISQMDDLRGKFRPFVQTRASAPRPDLRVRLCPAGRASFLKLRQGVAETYRMDCRVRGGSRDCWSYEFAGTLEVAAWTAELALVEASGPLFHRGLENYLRTLTASFILGRGGLLLHGAGVVRGGKAYVFFGPSGSGKTTVTHLSPTDTVLSDDLTLLVATERGFEAAGIPFGMAHHHVPDTHRSFPIASLNRLVQSQEVKRSPLAGARAVAQLSASLPFVMDFPGDASRALMNVDRLLSSVPAFRLQFRKDGAFWNVTEEA